MARISAISTGSGDEARAMPARIVGVQHSAAPLAHAKLGYNHSLAAWRQPMDPDDPGYAEPPADLVGMSFPGTAPHLGGVTVDESAAEWLAEWAAGQDDDWHPGWGNRGAEIAELVQDAVRQAVVRMPPGVALELDAMDGEGLDVSAWRVLVTISASPAQEPLRLAGPQRFAEPPAADGEEYAEYTADESVIAASAAQALRSVAADASAQLGALDRVLHPRGSAARPLRQHPGQAVPGGNPGHRPRPSAG